MIYHRYANSLTVLLTLQTREPSVRSEVIAALRAQTMPKWHWRLVVVNAIPGKVIEGLEEAFSWHPRALIVQADDEGPATLTARAMLASRTDLVAVLDDRSMLTPEYLDEAVRIAEKHVFLGMFGGIVRASFTRRRPTWQRRFLRLSGIRHVNENVSMQQTERRSMPAQTGFVVRREYLRRFAQIILRHPFFQEPGFAGHRADFDLRAALARTVVQSGASIGLFQELVLDRRILPHDLDERAIQERLRCDAFSRVIERFVWTGMLPEVLEPTRWERVALRWMRMWQFGRIPRLRSAHRQGVIQALDLAQHFSARVPTGRAAGTKTVAATPAEQHAGA